MIGVAARCGFAISMRTIISAKMKPIITAAKMDEFYNMVLTGLNANPEHKDGVRNMMKTNFIGIFGNDIIADTEEPSQASAPQDNWSLLAVDRSDITNFGRNLQPDLFIGGARFCSYA